MLVLSPDVHLSDALWKRVELNRSNRKSFEENVSKIEERSFECCSDLTLLRKRLTLSKEYA
jgi:hypothetical protein